MKTTIPFPLFNNALAALCLTAGLVLVSSPSATLAARPSGSSMSLQVLKNSGPHEVAKAPDNIINLYFRVRGLTYGPSHGPKARNKAGQGHLAIYLDRIPTDARTRPDLTNIFNDGMTNLHSVSVQPNNAYINTHKGQHTLLIALAKNDDVLYDVAPERFVLFIK